MYTFASISQCHLYSFVLCILIQYVYLLQINHSHINWAQVATIRRLSEHCTLGTANSEHQMNILNISMRVRCEYNDVRSPQAETV